MTEFRYRNVQWDPAREAIGASGGLDGRAGGAATFSGKRWRAHRPLRRILGEYVADGLGFEIQIQLGAVLE